MRFGLLVGFLFFPAIALAADTSLLGRIVPLCTESGLGAGVCQACNLAQLASRILVAMVALAVMGSAIMLAYAGWLYLSASGDHGNLESAKKVFSSTFIGLVIVLVAWLVVDITLRTFTNQSLNVLTSFQCVKVQTVGGSFTFPETPQDNSDVVAQSSADYCTDAELPGFQSMIGSAIDKHGNNLLNGNMSGIELYCPKFAVMSAAERKAFWVRYMTGVAQYESSCNSSPKPFPEPTLGKDGVTGTTVMSEGLFQLSYGSERRRASAAGDGTCYFDPAKQDINDPIKNTNCAIFILNSDASGRPKECAGLSQFECATRYWAVARSKRAQLIAATKDVKGCR